MKTIAEIFGLKPPKVSEVPLVGLELEVEGDCINAVDLKGWNIVRDGSLRDGREFVLSTPMRRLALDRAVVNLSKYLSTTRCVLSHRTSLHVHIDMRNYTILDIEKIYKLYALFEPALYTISGKHRASNIYCPGFTFATEQVKQAALAFSVKDVGSLVNTSCKYTGLNLAALCEFGSIEIRTHCGSLNAHDILNWVDILLAIIAWATSHTLEEIMLLQSGSSRECIYAVFKDKLQLPIVYKSDLCRYWDNAKYNVLYMSLIDEMLLTTEPIDNKSILDNEELINEINRRV